MKLTRRGMTLAGVIFMATLTGCAKRTEQASVVPSLPSPAPVASALPSVAINTSLPTSVPPVAVQPKADEDAAYITWLIGFDNQRKQVESQYLASLQQINSYMTQTSDTTGVNAKLQYLSDSYSSQMEKAASVIASVKTPLDCQELSSTYANYLRDVAKQMRGLMAAANMSDPRNAKYFHDNFHPAYGPHGEVVPEMNGTEKGANAVDSFNNSLQRFCAKRPDLTNAVSPLYMRRGGEVVRQ